MTHCAFSLSLRSVAAHERSHKNQPELAGIIDSAADEIERLRAGIQDYLDGGCDRPGIARKVDKCPHGRFGWEACEGCIDEHFAKVLRPVDEQSTAKPADSVGQQPR